MLRQKPRGLLIKEYCVMDLGKHMNITAEHCQAAAQDCQNIWHLYSWILSVMKQSWRCFWLPLFCECLLSFPAANKSLSTNHKTAKKFKRAFSIWCSLELKEKWHLLQKHKIQTSQTFYRSASSHQDTISPKLKRNIWYTKVLCWRNFLPVHIRGLSQAIWS